MRTAAKKDGNHRGIVRSLRALPGVSVADTAALGKGFPDIVVGYKGANYLFEIKDGSKPPSQRKLTEDEELFHKTWKGDVWIVESFTEAFNIIMKRKPGNGAG